MIVKTVIPQDVRDAVIAQCVHEAMEHLKECPNPSAHGGPEGMKKEGEDQAEVILACAEIGLIDVKLTAPGTHGPAGEWQRTRVRATKSGAVARYVLDQLIEPDMPAGLANSPIASILGLLGRGGFGGMN